MHQIFVPSSNFKKNYVFIEGEDYHHLVNVLRIKKGEKLYIVVDRGERYVGSVKNIDKEKVIVELVEKIYENYEPIFNLYIAQSIPKGKKFENLVRYGTELGVKGFFPLITERTIVKLNKEKIERMRKIAKEEAQVSKRDKIPYVSEPIKFIDFLNLSKKYHKKYIFWELEKENNIDNAEISENEDVLVVIGNEGGFSLKEVDLAKESGFISLSLGKRILRSELAPIVIITLILYKGNEFRI